jgi:hypothetical protein
VAKTQKENVLRRVFSLPLHPGVQHSGKAAAEVNRLWIMAEVEPVLSIGSHSKNISLLLRRTAECAS